MVRLKTRWCLARLEFEHDNDTAATTTSKKNKPSSTSLFFPSSGKDLFVALRDQHVANFGLAATAEAQEIQVRFCDPTTQLVLFRAPRDAWPRIRCTVTLLTHLSSNQLCTMTILSVHGNVRTAKTATIQHVQRCYQTLIRNHATTKNDATETATTKSTMAKSNSSQKKPPLTRITKQLCAMLESSLAEIHAIDF